MSQRFESTENISQADQIYSLYHRLFIIEICDLKPKDGGGLGIVLQPVVDSWSGRQDIVAAIPTTYWLGRCQNNNTEVGICLGF